MSPSSLLKELIAIPSVNPMGRQVDGPEFLEGGMTSYLENWLTTLGVPFQRIEVEPGRCNVVARYEGNPNRPVVMLDAHQDTVPVEGMVIPPFEPSERNGRIYGRGSCDVKGGMASMLTAFARIVREQPNDCGDVIMSCTCDEEHGMNGILNLASGWLPEPGGDWLTRRPDMVIIAEPTSLDIVVAHRGVTRWALHTSGRASHSSRPSEGVNAIYHMAEILQHLKDYANLLEQTEPHHPLCGTPTLSVGRIGGGISVNVVPDSCWIEIDRRVLPGEDQTTVIDQVTNYLQDRGSCEFDMGDPWCVVGPLSNDFNTLLADRLMSNVESVVGPRNKVGVPYGTNAAATDALGVPTVVFGPGSIDQAHTKDEWIEAKQLEQAAEILFRFLAGG
jgi:acetylornithine deacetylase/succinyl-diaminopimelate desuccinylase family protein